MRRPGSSAGSYNHRQVESALRRFLNVTLPSKQRMPEAWRDETGNTHRRVLLFSVAVGKGGRTVDVGIADSRPPLPSGRTAEPVTFSANVGEYGARSVTDDLYGARRFASEKLAVQRGVIEELAAQAQVALGEAALQGVAADGIAGAAPDTSIAG